MERSFTLSGLPKHGGGPSRTEGEKETKGMESTLGAVRTELAEVETGESDSLKGIVDTKKQKNKLSVKKVLLDFGVGFLAVWVGGDGFGKQFYKKAIFNKKGYYMYGNVSYSRLPILKPIILKQFVKSLTTYVGSAIVSRISLG